MVMDNIKRRNVIIIILSVIILLLLKGCIPTTGGSGGSGGSTYSGGGSCPACPVCDSCKAPEGYYAKSGVTTNYPTTYASGNSCYEISSKDCIDKGKIMISFQLTGNCCIWSCGTDTTPSSTCDDRGNMCTDSTGTYYNSCVDIGQLREYTCNTANVCSPTTIRCNSAVSASSCISGPTGTGSYCGFSTSIPT